jgi:xanthine dehydrogenase large subunit
MTAATTRAGSPLHQPAPHESGLRHTTGEASYVDDLPPLHGALVAQAIVSPHAHARIVRRDVSSARQSPGVAAVLLAEDIPGDNQIGAVVADEPLLATDEVHAEGQPVAIVVAESYAACRRAASLVQIEYEVLPAILTTRDAVAAGSFLSDPHVIERGDVDAALAAAPFVLSGEFESGAQEHFYLETQCALAIPDEHGAMKIFSSTQHPSEVQAKVAEILHVGRHAVVVEVLRMGGGFGGKETQGAHVAAMAALGAHHTGRPVKVWLNRDQDMIQTGKRHPFFSRYEAGFDHDGRLLALRADVFANGGWSNDLSRSILDRALFHIDNCYYIPTLRFVGRVARTNLASMTAFRGFGGPQGMLLGEEILSRIAERLGKDPLEVRRANYYGEPPRNYTPYGQEVTDFRGARITDELVRSSEYAMRRAAIDRFNASHETMRRGIALQPVKFGISFTASFLNQAGAFVAVYADGSVQLNHGGTEMGQGLHTKMLAVCAHELGVPLSSVRVMNTATDKVPNTSATAASSGSDLNGQAIRQACETIRERLRPVAAEMLGVPQDEAPRLVFEEGRVFWPGHEGCEATFRNVAQTAYFKQVPLFSSGYYRTPGIHYDRARGQGRPFFYFAYGAAVVEVEICSLTGEMRVLRTDILHDVGRSLVPTVDVGQVEGAFVQGLGWLTFEELVWDASGHLVTHSPSTYKIPAVGDAPADLRVSLLERAPQEGVIHGSKAVGEPPLMLAIGIVSALRHAIASFGSPREEVRLAIPATPESILRAIEDVRTRAAPDAASHERVEIPVHVRSP